MLMQVSRLWSLKPTQERHLPGHRNKRNKHDHTRRSTVESRPRRPQKRYFCTKKTCASNVRLYNAGSALSELALALVMRSVEDDHAAVIGDKVSEPPCLSPAWIKKTTKAYG